MNIKGSRPVVSAAILLLKKDSFTISKELIKPLGLQIAREIQLE